MNFSLLSPPLSPPLPSPPLLPHPTPHSQMSQVIQWWRLENMELGMLVVEEKEGESKEEKTLNMEISAMIGIGLYQLQFANNDELDITRRKMVA